MVLLVLCLPKRPPRRELATPRAPPTRAPGTPPTAAPAPAPAPAEPRAVHFIKRKGAPPKAAVLLKIIGIYRAVPQLDYSRCGIDRNLFKTDATDFPIPELDSIGMQTQFRCELSAPLIGLM